MVATVLLKRDKDPPDCEHPSRGFTRTYYGVWRWDPEKQEYRQVSGNLDEALQVVSAILLTGT